MCTYAASSATSKSSSSLGGRTLSAYSSAHMVMYFICLHGVKKKNGIPFLIPVSNRLHFFDGWSRFSNLFKTPLPQATEVFQAAHAGFLEEQGSVKAEGMYGHYGRALENEQ